MLGADLLRKSPRTGLQLGEGFGFGAYGLGGLEFRASGFRVYGLRVFTCGHHEMSKCEASNGQGPKSPHKQAGRCLKRD